LRGRSGEALEQVGSEGCGNAGTVIDDPDLGPVVPPDGAHLDRRLSVSESVLEVIGEHHGDLGPVGDGGQAGAA
jgi:hypothetical protein